MSSTSEPMPRAAALADDVYESVRVRIVDNAIAPGERVNIDALSRELGVSHTPLREAMARLEADGLVTKQPNRGYRTTALLGEDELVHLYELRLLTEPWLAGRAAANVTDQDKVWLHEELQRAHQALAEAPRDVGWGGAARAMSEHDRRFHDGLARMAGNPVVRDALARTQIHLHVFRLHYETGFVAATVREHGTIAKAVAAGRAEGAERAMRRHLEGALRRLRPRARGAAPGGAPP